MILTPGTVIASRYEIIDKIGSGGMANVYRARDRKLDRFVTFKVMREDFVNDNEFRARFNVEAQSAASLSNQNIVNVYDVGQEDLVHYIVMEYIDGVTLKDLIKRRAPFENDEILGVATQIASGICHAHENNIIHRDIKPQNILVTSTGNIKVTDFGIARAASQATVSTATNAMGSAHYFSPEQARGGYIDYKTDIYSLGIVMFEMATGVLPFDGDSAVTIAVKHFNEPLPNIKDLNPNISDSIVKIIEKATEKLAANRYQSTNELLDDLKRAITNTTGDFVKRNEEATENSPTIQFNTNEVQTLKDGSTKKQPIDIIKKDSVNYGGDEFVFEEDEKRPKSKKVSAPEDVQKLSDRKIKIAAVATSVVLIVIIIAIGSFFINKLAAPKPPQLVTMPTIEGKTIEEATTLASELGFSLNPISEPSDTVEVGHVISVILGNDNLVYEGDIVDVSVSIGTDKIVVPDLTSKTFDEVTEIFKTSKFSFVDKYVFDEQITMNVVVSQDPKAGEMAKPTKQIKVYFSQGPEVKTVVVPYVIDKTEAEAILLLEENKLAVGRRSEMASDKKEGTVLVQTVNAGETVSVGSSVGLVVSSGPTVLEPTPSPTASSSASKPLKIALSDGVPAGTDKVHLLVIRNSANGSVKVFSEDVPTSEFPKTVDVTGKGDVQFLVEISDVATGTIYGRGTEGVTFAE